MLPLPSSQQVLVGVQNGELRPYPERLPAVLRSVRICKGCMGVLSNVLTEQRCLPDATIDGPSQFVRQLNVDVRGRPVPVNRKSRSPVPPCSATWTLRAHARPHFRHPLRSHEVRERRSRFEKAGGSTAISTKRSVPRPFATMSGVTRPSRTSEVTSSNDIGR